MIIFDIKQEKNIKQEVFINFCHDVTHKHFIEDISYLCHCYEYTFIKNYTNKFDNDLINFTYNNNHLSRNVTLELVTNYLNQSKKIQKQILSLL